MRVSINDLFKVCEHFFHDSRIPELNHFQFPQTNQTRTHHHPEGLIGHFVGVCVSNDFSGEGPNENEGFEVGKGEKGKARAVGFDFGGEVRDFDTGDELGIERRREEGGFEVSEKVFEEVCGYVGVVCEGAEGGTGKAREEERHGKRFIEFLFHF